MVTMSRIGQSAAKIWFKTKMYVIIMDIGQIYCITSPSGKRYTGQCVKVLSNGKTWGYERRWKQHVCDALRGKDYCRLLNNAIRKYSPEAFSIVVLEECNVNELDAKENFYITTYNTMSPNGYNLISGKSNCRQSDETKALRQQSMLGKNVGKRYTKRDRQREEDQDLPKYIRSYRDASGKEGYRVSHHPVLEEKSFVSKKLTMSEKLTYALSYLQSENGSTSIRQLES